MFQKSIILVLSLIILSSCAKQKIFEINNKRVVCKPFGWANYQTNKCDSVYYQICMPNVILDIVFSETIIVPVWLTGKEFYEPVMLKKDKKY